MNAYCRAFGVCILTALNGCVSWVPVNPLTPAVEESASSYGEVMANFSDQALLANVLRAKDKKPLNFNDLSSITGSFSLSNMLALPVPFGPLTGTVMGSSAHRLNASPSVTGTSSPTITVGTLNTQGFMMTMVQPISTTYVLSKWDSYPHELLLYLFVKAIRFPDELDSPAGCAKTGTCATRKVYRNDPDDPGFGDFKTLIAQMTAQSDPSEGNVDMKSLMVLDPLGIDIPIGQTVSSTTPIPTQSPSSTVVAPLPPTLSESITENVLAGTYFVRVTYVSSTGESPPSGESVIAVHPHHGFSIALSPQAPPAGVSGFNVYAGTSSGAETRQNSQPVDVRAGWPGTAALIVGTLPPGTQGTQYVIGSDATIFQTINGLTDGQLHVGNARCPQHIASGPHALELCPPESRFPYVRFYKEYQAQIVLCLDTDPDTGMFHKHFIVAMSKEERKARADFAAAKRKSDLDFDRLLQSAGDVHALLNASKEWALDSQSIEGLDGTLREESARSGQSSVSALVAGLAKPSPGTPPSNNASPSTNGPAAGGAGGGGGGGGAGSGGGTGAMPQVTLALQPSRISGMLRSNECKGDQMVLPEESEEHFERESGKFTHVEWRSIAEVIEYLGAVARTEEGEVNKITDSDEMVQTVNNSGMLKIGDDVDETLFTYGHGRAGKDGISVKYRGTEYRVPSRELASKKDHSLEALAMLNELISIAKISGGLPVPQPVTVLP
jgi:hypothetical protein